MCRNGPDWPVANRAGPGQVRLVPLGRWQRRARLGVGFAHRDYRYVRPFIFLYQIKYEIRCFYF